MNNTINDLMKKHGFVVGSSGGGCLWYTKETIYKNKPAFIAITDQDGCDIPKSLEQPIMVGLHDLEEGEISDEVKDYSSLKNYLETI